MKYATSKSTMTLLCAAVLVAVVSLPQDAAGGGFLVSKIGGDTATVTEASPAGIFWNPAAIGRIDGTAFYADNNVVFRRHSYWRDTRQVRDDGVLYPRERFIHFDPQPMLAVTTDLGTDRLSLGIGGYVPFGSTSTLNSEGAHRWQSIYGGILGGVISPVASVRITDGLYVGASASYVRAAVFSYRALDFGPLVAEETGGNPPPEDPGNEGRAHLDFEGNAYAYGFGALWEIGDWVLGASYTSEIDIEIDGRMQVFIPRNDFYETMVGGDIDEPATLRATWPRAVRAGFSWRPHVQWGLGINAEWVHWSLYDQIEIDVHEDDIEGVGNIDQVEITEWQNTLNVRVGLRHYFDGDDFVFVGMGVENSAIPIERLGPDVFDAPKVGVALVGSRHLTDRLKATAGYTHIFYLPRQVEETQREHPPTGYHRQMAGLLNTNLTFMLP